MKKNILNAIRFDATFLPSLPSSQINIKVPYSIRMLILQFPDKVSVDYYTLNVEEKKTTNIMGYLL